MAQKVLIADDDQVVHEALGIYLKAEGFEVVDAFDGVSAIESITPEVVLCVLDIMMPKMSGIEVCREIRKTSQLPILMLTAKGEEIDRIVGLELGADDYIVKPFSLREVVARIKAVLRRRAPQMTEDCVVVDGLRVDPVSHRVHGNGQSLDLGPTEFRLLHFFMTHAERVHSRAQLLDQVWGDHIFVEERTVDVHIRRLRSALEATGHDRLIQTVRGSGYRFSAQPE